jgi:hypothetical protein
MVADSEDYREIDSLAVHREDVVSAFETNRTPGPRAVLRVTPPFAGRERARLHVESEGEYAEDPRPLHVDPATLLDFEGVPAYPSAAETEDDLRADPDREYSIESHHATHTDRVADWRETVGEAIVASAELDGRQGSHRVQILALG